MIKPVKDPTLLAIISAINKSAEKVPKDFQSTDEWAKQWKLSTSTAYRWLKKGVSSGIYERRMFRVMTNDGYSVKVPYYKFLPKIKK